MKTTSPPRRSQGRLAVWLPTGPAPAVSLSLDLSFLFAHFPKAVPHDEERELLHQVIPKTVIEPLLDQAAELLNVHEHEYDNSIRHNLVAKGLQEAMAEFGTNPPRQFKNIPLAVERRTDNPDYVTWSSPATILGEWRDTFELLTETRVTAVGKTTPSDEKHIEWALVRDLKTNQDRLIRAKVCQNIPILSLAVLTHRLGFCPRLRLSADAPDLVQQWNCARTPWVLPH